MTSVEVEAKVTLSVFGFVCGIVFLLLPHETISKEKNNNVLLKNNLDVIKTLNLEYFIAKRLIAAKSYKSSISSPIIKIAITAIAIGIIMMIMAVATGVGLQDKIREKVSAFNGHIIISNFDDNQSQVTTEPISINQSFYPKFKNVDAGAGTVDIEYHLVEKGASQIELQGGYGGGGFIGTLGLSFNNFSARNMFKKEAYKPLPMGDGQKVSLRLQASTFFQTYSVSFSEPWFGGKKPVSFSSSLSYSKQFLQNYSSGNARVDKSKNFNILSLSVGISKRLSEPDDFTYLSHAVSFQNYDLNNYFTGLFSFGNGFSNNLAYTIGITHTNKGFNPIFPTYGSEFSFSAKFTPPYSLFNGVDYKNLGELKENKYIYDGSIGDSYVGENGIIVNKGDYVEAIPTQNTRPNSVTDYKDAVADPAKVDQKKFNWLEYYKIKFKADWYTKLYGKFVLRTLGEFGFMGAYNQNRGLVPFERFFLGGDGMQNFAMDGRETIQLRGYPNNSLTPLVNGTQDGATVYNKFSMELRYPITLKASASIYALAFMEAGSSYTNFKSYNPFDLSRSAGFGLRVFMPAFGLLGIDFGHGFDPIPGQTKANGWETHFIIGQQF